MTLIVGQAECVELKPNDVTLAMMKAQKAGWHFSLQVHEQIDLTFASGIRTLLRQDPDIIMVGEIRDQDTADMAIQNVIGDGFRGATWVSIHNGGGVGWGEVINGGFGMLLDAAHGRQHRSC